MNNNKGECENVMFLFGAGISIPIGIPAMEGIYRAFMNKRKSGRSNKNKKTCEFFTKDMNVKPDLEEFLLAANTITEFKSSSLSSFVENNISRIKTSQSIKKYRENFNEKLGDVTSVRKEILDFLSLTCFKFDRKQAMEINSGFVSVLSEVGYPVYSTNYDYSLEYVAIENKIEILDNFIKKGQRHLWNKDIGFEGRNGLKLIKLHGSVTWYMDDNQEIEKIYSSTEINPMGKKVERIVIVPTRFKDIYDQHFFALYSHFLSSLARSNLIIIAGHSLRDDYLRAGIIERKRKGNFQIIVIDPTYPLEVKKELPPARRGTKGDIIHMPYRWEEISNELSHILLTSPSHQIVDQCVNVLKKHKYTSNKLKIKGNLGALWIGQNKNFSVDLNAYLSVDEKPSKLRAWLGASYTNKEGVAKSQISSAFIEVNPVLIGEGLSGLIDESAEIEVEIPEIGAWLEAGCKVSLFVGLVRPNVKTPSGTRGRNPIIKDSRLLVYKKRAN